MSSSIYILFLINQYKYFILQKKQVQQGSREKFANYYVYVLDSHWYNRATLICSSIGKWMGEMISINHIISAQMTVSTIILQNLKVI